MTVVPPNPPSLTPANPHVHRWLDELHRLQTLRDRYAAQPTDGVTAFLWNIRVRILLFLLHTQPDEPSPASSLPAPGFPISPTTPPPTPTSSPFEPPLTSLPPFSDLADSPNLPGRKPRTGPDFHRLLQEITDLNESIREQYPRFPPYWVTDQPDRL